MIRSKFVLRLSRSLPLALLVVALFSGSLVVAAQSSSARDLAVATPSEVGMSAEGIEKVKAEMHGMVDRGELAGVVTMVARHGKIVLFDNYGYQDVEANVPMEKDTIVRIFSMTKPIAGVALMTLFEEGKFQLSDPVEQYIPELKNLKVAKEDGPDGMPILEEPDHKMTIRELVSHTGGLTYGIFSRSQTDLLYQKANILDRDQTLKEFVTKLGKLPLRQQPGTLWHYSVSVDVQGYLIEVLSGKTFDQYLEEKIFQPLGMKDTSFWVEESKAHRLSKAYTTTRDGELVAQPFGAYLTKPGFFSGGGGLTGTAMDYMRFAQMVLNGGELDGVRIIKPETVKMMHTNQLPDGMEEISPMISNPGNKFGIDFSLVENPQLPADHPLAKGEFWWYGAAGTWFGINPIQDTVVVGMIQSQGGSAARDARFNSKRLAYEAILDPAKN